MKNRKLLSWYFYWPLILTAFLVAFNITLFFTSSDAAGIMLAVTLPVAALSVFLFLTGRAKIREEMIRFADGYDTTRQKILEEMGTAAVICDKDGAILWRNRAFRDILKKERIMAPNILGIFPDFTKEMLEPADERTLLHSSVGDMRYQLELQWGPYLRVRGKNEDPSEDSDTALLIVITDETELVEYRRQYEDSRACQGIITLDNYDEALGTVDEVRRSLLTALVDRKISNYFGSMNAFVKKFEVDKYLLFVQEKDMSRVAADRFSILEDVKTINIGNSLNLTLSIGIGMGGQGYDENYEAARKAMDLALGRGGDQAVVIADGNISYFGGKSTAAARNTRVKARVKAHAFREILDSKDQVIVMGHKNGDVDALGASVGIWRIATALGKKAYIVNGNTELSVQPFKDCFTESGKYPENFLISGEEALELVDPHTLVVVVDVNRPSYTEEPALLEKGCAVVVIDHHRMGSETIVNPVLSYVEPFASSASEMVSELIQYVDDTINVQPVEADVMYGGIVLDTQNFTVQAGVRTFEAAAFLKRKGADAVRVRKMFRDDFADFRAKADTVGSAKVYKDHFIISVCDPEGSGSPTIIGAQAANSLLEIKGIKAAIVLTPYNGRIFISARSIDEINVQVLMEKLGGGGHKSVAGAQIEGTDTDAAVASVTAAIDQMIEEGEVN